MDRSEEFCPAGVSATLHGVGQGLRRIYRPDPRADDDAAIVLLLRQLDQVPAGPVFRRS